MMIGDATPADIRLAIVEAMIQLAGHGSVPAATAAARLVDQLEAAQLRDEYAAQVTDAKPCEAVRYLAGLGFSPEDCLDMTGSEASERALMAFERGQQERLVCARAAERRAAYQTGKPPAWMDDQFDAEATWKRRAKKKGGK